MSDRKLIIHCADTYADTLTVESIVKQLCFEIVSQSDQPQIMMKVPQVIELRNQLNAWLDQFEENDELIPMVEGSLTDD